jgi:hypothetical protein
MRFYQSSTPQYVSQFTPLPLDFMAQQIKAREAADATTEDFINKVDELKLKPGNHTDPLVVDKYNEWLDNNKNTIAQKFHAGEIDSSEATRALGKLQSAYQNDPAIRNIKTDAVLSAATNTAIAQGKYKRGISSRGSLLGDMPQFQYIDPRNASEADYAQAHNYITPTSIKSDQNFGPQYKEIEARVTNTFNSLEPTKQIINGITYYKQGNSLVEKKQLTRDMVKSMAMDLANTEINDQITPWTQYKTRLKQQEGQDYTADELAEDITDNYFGYVNSKSTKNQYQWDAAQTSEGNKKDGKGRIARRAAVMPEKNVGFKATDFYKTSNNLNPSQDFDKNMFTSKNNTLSPGEDFDKNMFDSKKPGLIGYQIYELSTNMQNVVKEYIKDKPKWKKVFENPNKKYSGLEELYKEIEDSGILKLYEEGQIKSQSNLRTILPGTTDEFGNNDWSQIFGSNTSPTLENMNGTILGGTKQWINTKTGEITTISELMDLDDGDAAKTPISAIGEYQADNSMNIFLPDNLQGNYGLKPLSINIGGDEYITTSVFNPDPEDFSIRDIHNVIYEQNSTNLKKGTPINISINTDNGLATLPVRIKYNKTNKTYKLLNTDGNPATGVNGKPLEYSSAIDLYTDLLNQFYNQQ